MKNTVCEELHAKIGELALVKGEEWRLGEGAEIMDALQAHEVMLGVVGDSISRELLQELGAAKEDFDRRVISVLCKRCTAVVQATPEDLKKALNFYHKERVINFNKQISFDIPFTKKRITITLWNVGDFRQPKVFIR